MVSGGLRLEWLVWKDSLEGEAIATQIFHHHKHIKKKKKEEKRLLEEARSKPIRSHQAPLLAACHCSLIMMSMAWGL